MARRHALTFIAMLFVSLLAAVTGGKEGNLAFACSCAGNVTIEEREAGSDAVFAGLVVAVASNSLVSESAVLLVRDSWKGVNEKIVLVSTHSSGTACGSGFQTGREYLIFASSHNGALNTGSCGGTQPINSAADDMQGLGDARIPLLYPIKVDILSAPLIGLIGAIAGIVVFVKIRKEKKPPNES